MTKITEAPLLLRIPMPMKAWLKDRADANDRSMTAELKQIIKAVQNSEQGSVAQ